MGWSSWAILTHSWAGTTHSYSAVIAISGVGAILVTNVAITETSGMKAAAINQKSSEVPLAAEGILSLVPFHFHPIYDAMGGCRCGYPGRRSASFQLLLSWKTQQSKWSKVCLPYSCSVWANFNTLIEMSSEFPLEGLGRKNWIIKTKSGDHQHFHCKKEEKLAKDWEKVKEGMQRRRRQYLWKGGETHLIQCCRKAEEEKGMKMSLNSYHAHCWWLWQGQVQSNAILE